MRRVLPELLATRFVAGEETLFRGVRKLLPGRTLVWSSREGVRERRYWHLPAATDHGPSTLEEAAAACVPARGQVESHLMSDVRSDYSSPAGSDSTGLAPSWHAG